jgi:mRNA-degrading endonuclease toxin of MazEF toxin-antitoxin module
MRNLKLVLSREPAAIGSLVASILPVLVLLDVIKIDEAGIAAVVVAINTAVGFAIRVFVSPTGTTVQSPAPAPAAEVVNV